MGLGKKTIDDENYCGKKVLVRCDFNVPMKDGVITNENRINAALPTIQKLINDGAKVILCSHLGKPKNGPEAKFSLAPVAVALSAKLGKTVVFADDDTVVGDNAKAAVAAMNNGDVVLLQNTRFRKEETKNMPEFSQDLASLADAYVDDAFGSCHRAHCSTAGVTEYVKDTAVGYLMEKEIKYLGNAVNDPERPFTAILGGAKVADKLNVISNLLEKVDTLIIGGGMAYTFIKAQGYEVGKSLCDDSKLDYCKEMMAKAEAKGVKLLLPVDAACIKDFPDPIDAPVEVTIVPVTAIPADMEGCDVGPETMKIFAEAVKASKTVVWNGPMGVFENPTLAAGTLAVAVGRSVPLYQLGLSLTTAETALRNLNFHRPLTDHVCAENYAVFDDLTLEIVLSSVSPDDREEFSGKTIHQLSLDEKELLRTYFSLEMSLADAAEKLFLHKNTLQYKLNHIYKKCGLNPRKFRDAVLLYLALELE